MKKFLKFLPVVLGTFAIAPMALSLGSCSFVDSYKPYEITTSSIANNVQFNDLPKCNYSLNDLFYGEKGFHNGNYVVIIGSTTNLSLDQFLFTNADGTKISNVPSNGIARSNYSFQNSPLSYGMNEFETLQGSFNDIDVGIALYIEDTPMDEYVFNGGDRDRENQVVGPFEV